VLQVIGLTLAGGLLLLFVSWKMYRQIVDGDNHSFDSVEANLASDETPAVDTGFWGALWTIILADLSMSLDNVLAVAGAAGESTLVLVIGLAVAIVLMAVASTYIARLLARYPWIAWLGLLIILYVALDMIYRDSHHIACAAWGVGCSETIIRRWPTRTTASLCGHIAAVTTRWRSGACVRRWTSGAAVWARSTRTI